MCAIADPSDVKLGFELSAVHHWLAAPCEVNPPTGQFSLRVDNLSSTGTLACAGFAIVVESPGSFSGYKTAQPGVAVLLTSFFSILYPTHTIGVLLSSLGGDCAGGTRAGECL